MIETRDDAVIESIIRATNSQTALKPEQLFALMEFSKKLEIFFQAFEEQYKLYYERRDGQYDRLAIEKTRIITPTNAIRAFAAMFLGEPHRTTRNYRALREKVGQEIFVDGHKLDPYYASSYALYRLDFLFRNGYITKDFKAARYHILLALRLMINADNLPPMNSHSVEKRAGEIIIQVHNTGQVDKMFEDATKIITKVTSGDLARDNVRRAAITEAIFGEFGQKVTTV